MAAKQLLNGELFQIGASYNHIGNTFISGRDGTDTYEVASRISDKYGAIGASVAIDNYTKLYVIRGVNVELYDLTQRGVPILWQATPVSTPRSLSISDDGQYLLIGGYSEVVLLDTQNAYSVIATWSATISTGLGYSACHISGDGSTIIKRSDSNASIVEVIDRVSMSVTHTVSRYNSNSYGGHIFVSQTGKYVCVASASSSYRIYDTVNDVEVGVISGISMTSTNNNQPCFIYYGDEDHLIFSAGYNSNAIKVWDLSTATSSQTQSIYGGSGLIKVSDTIAVCREWTGDYRAYKITINPVTHTLVSEVITDAGNGFFFLRVATSGAYEIIDMITETLAIDTFKVSAFDAETNTLIVEKEVTAGQFSIQVPYTAPYTVTVTPVVNRGVWAADTVYDLDDLVYSNQPQTYDWVYKCVQAGLSNSFPPLWQTTATTQFSDGTAIWEAIEPIAMPITKSPILPTPV